MKILIFVLMFTLTSLTKADPYPPSITGLSVSSGQAGDVIKLNGAGFEDAMSVSFGGVNSLQYSVESPTLLNVQVPPAAISGKIVVTNKNGSGSSSGSFSVIASSPCAPSVVSVASLLISSLSVVNSSLAKFITINPAAAPLSFPAAMSKLKPKSQSTSDFILNFLRQFGSVSSLNGYPVVQKPQINGLINNWPKLADGSLNLDLAPFRLLAVSVRFDDSMRTTKQAGEGRLVYGVLDPLTSLPLDFTVILEYALLIKESSQPEVTLTLDDWARKAQELSLTVFGSSDYMNKLGSVVNLFTANSYASHVNGSALNHARTNEIELSRKDPKLSAEQAWSMRDFALSASGQLQQIPMGFQPSTTLDNTQGLVDWVSSNADVILAQTASVPPSYLAGEVKLREQFQWLKANDISIDEALRSSFGQQTCNGCHTRESTQGTKFAHILPRSSNKPSVLSFFLIDALPGRESTLKSLVKSANGCAQ